AAGGGRPGPGQGRRRPSRRRWVPVVVVVVTCFLAAYGIVSLVSGSGQRPAAPSSTPHPTATAPPPATAVAPRDLHIVRHGRRVTLTWTPPVDPNVVTVLYQSADGAGWTLVGVRRGGRAVVTLGNRVGRHCFRLQVVVGGGPGSAPGNKVCTRIR